MSTVAKGKGNGTDAVGESMIREKGDNVKQTITVRTPDGKQRDLPPDQVNRLRASLSGSLLDRNSSGYEEARRVWNGMIDRYPALIACCTSTEDVQRVVTFAHEHQAILAVRGGGHSFPGYSTCDDGIVLDLSPMRQVYVDAVMRTARAESGLRWGDLDAATQQHGLVLTGGQISHTGIAGLTLGGGIGWLARAFGLTIDHLQGADVVTADGQLRRAAPDADADLFWAIRGGGGNFGVVTAFDYALNPLEPQVTVLQIAFPIHEAANVFQAGEALLAAAPDSVSATFAFVRTPEGMPLAALTVVAIDPPDDAVQRLEPFRHIGPAVFEEIVTTPYTALQRMLDEVAAVGLRYYGRSNFLMNLTPEVVGPLAAHYEEAPSPGSLVLFVRLGGAVAHVAPEETAFAHRSFPWSLTALAIWRDPGTDEANRNWIERTWSSLPALPQAVYVNELEEEGSARVRAAYGMNYARLTALKKRYDPDNLFRRNQNIPPA